MSNEIKATSTLETLERLRDELRQLIPTLKAPTEVPINFQIVSENNKLWLVIRIIGNHADVIGPTIEIMKMIGDHTPKLFCVSHFNYELPEPGCRHPHEEPHQAPALP